MIERAARGAITIALVLFVVVGLFITDRTPGTAVLAALGVLAIGAVVAWQKVGGWPLAIALLLAAAGVAYLGHAQSSNLVWFGLCLVAGAAALSLRPAEAAVFGAVLLAIPAWQWLRQTEEPGWAAWTVGTVFTLVACMFARRQRVLVEQLREAQHQLAERSRAEERSRIAGEVHDVLGHALTISLLHIGSARLALDEAPDEARRALGEAERLARESLEEVRASVGLMRSTGETTPLPDATAIPDLVESFRTAGAGVRLDVTGDLAALGSARGLAAYRIVQEALTNATRHAPGEPVSVDIRVAHGESTIAVRNAGVAASPTASGSGLEGMRERAAGVGGRLEAGLVEGAGARGWLVEAVLPT